jgi:hypothetical protein
MRIALWSPGMAIVAPTHISPVGWLLSDLPFVNEADGYRLHRMLGRIFEAPGEHDSAQNTCVLNLFAQSKHVLLDMVATHVSVTESEALIVMTGRLVDSDLAGLMACASAVAPNEANHDASENDANENEIDNLTRFRELRSVSQAGSVKGDDDENPAQAAIDNASSTISSITMPSMAGGGQAAFESHRRDVDQLSHHVDSSPASAIGERRAGPCSSAGRDDAPRRVPGRAP